MVHPLLQRQLYQYYGNRRLIEEQYEVAKRWLDLVAAKTPGLHRQGRPERPRGTGTRPRAGDGDAAVCGAAARNVAELAADSRPRRRTPPSYDRLAGNIQKAYLEKFLDKASGQVGPGTQASQAFALYLNLVPAEQRRPRCRCLLDDIRGPRQGHLSTGIFGTKFMLDVLSREGHADTAYAIVNQKTFPGWGYMLDNGATTLVGTLAGQRQHLLAQPSDVRLREPVVLSMAGRASNRPRRPSASTASSSGRNS